MDLLYVILLILTVAIQDITSEFLQQSEIALELEEVLYSSDEESSLLQCANRCRFIDKTSAVEFKNFICRCIKYTESFGNKDTILTGLFTTKEIKKIAKPKVKQLTNIALQKPSSQSSSVSSSQPARFGNDGLTNSAAVTGRKDRQSWEVDLKGIFEIDHMVLNGYITDAYRNKAMYVDTREKDIDLWTRCKYIGNVASRVKKLTCEQTTRARYVKVGSTTNSYVYIYEFELYAYV